METAQEGESRQDLVEVDPQSRLRLGADELKASLEAVRIAQAAARARARRETRWTRVIAVGALMGVGATAWAAAHRPPKARPVATAPTVAAAAVPSVATPPEAAPMAAPPPEAPPADPPAPLQAIAPAERSVAAVAGDSSEQAARCDDAFEQRSWRTIASTCASAFEARPGESALAMRVAQAQYRLGHTAIAAGWAHKALALDADIPEAFVLVARAETEEGHARAAADAYRRYLTLAPRGWHAAEARRAVRAALVMR